MNKFNLLIACFLVLIFAACSNQQESAKETETLIKNPAAADFNQAASDEKAIAIADQVMEAMGGRENWDNTRFIKWTFLGGRRTLYWDKKEGNVRIDYPSQNMVGLINVFDNTGKISVGGEEMTDPDSVAKYVGQAKSIWINDSYWLVMPFKLKDSGVTLSHLRSDTTLNGKEADVLQLTFDGVGDTPENRYEVYVDKVSHLVTQWDFYNKVTDEKPRFKTPWADYKTYGNIKLSADRGKYALSNIAVYENLDDAVFTDFAPVE